jgi:hypothetical protein
MHEHPILLAGLLLGGHSDPPLGGGSKGPRWHLNDLAPPIFWGGGAIQEARVVGAALSIAEPPGQVRMSLEVGMVGDVNGGWDSW